MKRKRLNEKSPNEQCGFMRVSYLISVFLLTLIACGKENRDVEKPEITREVGEVCDNVRPSHPITDADESEGCDDDSECTLGANGRCKAVNGIGPYERICTYDSCFSDDDCGRGTTCSCGEDKNKFVAVRSDENTCVRSNCRTNADCGDYYCKPDHHPCQENHDVILGYFCTTEKDVCVNDSDCQKGLSCIFDRDQSKWVCDAYCE